MQMMRKSIAIMLIFAMLMAGALPMRVEAATKRFAKITELSGTVSVQKNGAEKSFKAFKGMSLAEGDSIETGVGSSATLEVDADRTVKIGDNTKVDLTELKGSVNKTKTSVKLWGGKVYVEVNKKLGSDERFDISTPTAVMGVRGTKFYVAYEKNKIRVGVVEGKVEAKVYTFEAKPGQEPTLSTVETVVLPSQEALIPEDAVDQKDVEIKEAELKDLDLFILKEIIKNPEGLSPETLKEIEDEMKRKEAEEAKLIAEQLEALKKLEIQQNNQPPVYENPTQPNELPQNNTPSSGGNDDRDRGSSTSTSVTPLSSISISGTAAVGQTLTAVTMPENATVSYQWMRSNSQYGTYENISGATAWTYTLSQIDLDYYLKVAVFGTGSYTGNAISQPTGKVAVAGVTISNIAVTGTPAIGETLALEITMSDGQPINNRVEYFAAVMESEISSASIGTIPVCSGSLTIPPTFELDAGGTGSIVGKYIDYGARVIGNLGSGQAAPRVGPVQSGDLLTQIMGATDATIEGYLIALYVAQNDSQNYPVNDIIIGNGLGYHRKLHHAFNQTPPVTAEEVKTQIDLVNGWVNDISVAADPGNVVGDIESDNALQSLLQEAALDIEYNTDKFELYLKAFNEGGGNKLSTYKKIQDCVDVIDAYLRFGEENNPTSWIQNPEDTQVVVNFPHYETNKCMVLYTIDRYESYDSALFPIANLPLTDSYVSLTSENRDGVNEKKNLIIVDYFCGDWTKAMIATFDSQGPNYGTHSTFRIILPSATQIPPQTPATINIQP